MEQILVSIVNESGDTAHMKLKLSTDPPWQIEALINGLLFKYYGEDLFEAMCLLRKDLERMKFLLLCNGSRIDVYPSRMSRQMGGGRKAYILKLGNKAKLSDLVDIFDEAEASLIGTVDEQIKYYQEWIRSLS